MPVASALVSLPGGAWHHGTCHRDAIVHAVTGADEMALIDGVDALPFAPRVTALLGRCVERVGTIDDEPVEETVRNLTIGDREALLLHLRRLTFGDRIDCLLACPDCRAPLESELSVGSLLIAPGPEMPREYHELSVADVGGTELRARFRLPTGADQEAVAPRAAVDPRDAAGLLVNRCIVEVRHEAEPGSLATAAPPSVTERIDALLPELDPQAELMFDLHCAACGHAFTTLFDAASFLFQELEARGAAVYREVHTLALHYHWSESEILAMTPAKRGRYLDLIAESMGVSA
jgi:hypothetical protein